MLAFLKNTVAQINVETRQGNAPVVRAQQTPAPAVADTEQKNAPKDVDAVTSGTQGISHYLAAHVQLQPPKPNSDDT